MAAPKAEAARSRRTGKCMASASLPQRASSPRHPGRPGLHDFLRDGTPGRVRSREPARRHEELVHDLFAGKTESCPEEFHPRVFRKGMLRVDPRGERAVGLPEREENSGVVDDRVELEAVPDDPGVREEAPLLFRAVAGDDFRIEALERRAEVRAL